MALTYSEFAAVTPILREFTMINTTGKRIRLVAVALLAAAAPLAFTPNHGLKFNSACAASRFDGSCCLLYTAICGLNGENFPGYQFNPGSCI